MTGAGAALVAIGAECIILAFAWFLVGRHRSRHADSPAWSAAFADSNVVHMSSKRHNSRGIEIYNPGNRSAIDDEAASVRARQHSESRRAVSGGADEDPDGGSEPVIVTGTSTPSGVAVVRALVAAGYDVVALDHDRLAPGLRLAQLGAVIPLASAPDFGITLAKIAERTGARALVPGDGAEFGALQQASDVLAEAGVATWLPSPDLIAACADRRSLSAGEPVARQFEADLLGGHPGSLVAAVPRWRLATCGHQTMAAETFEDDEISALLDSVCRSIELEGPATVTGFVADDDSAVITDVSLGFSSCVALDAAAGADIVVTYTRKLRGDGLPCAPMPYRSGVRMVRHLDEVFET